MDRFSDRIGVTKRRETLQIGEMDQPLRNSIWNAILLLFDGQRHWLTAGPLLIVDFWKKPVDDIERHSDAAVRTEVRERYFGLPWYDVYNFIEYIVRNAKSLGLTGDESLLMDMFNGVLEREGSGYRFIAGTLVAISNETEVAAIDDALEAAQAVGMAGVSSHLKQALVLLGQKPEPDYRNSIKESISAVESAAKFIDGSKGGGLKDALKRLARSVEMHPAMLDAFLKLYGYTSDEDGIRHALLDAPSVGYHEAKFMLVACSAFANFLIGRSEAAGLLKGHKPT
jgi:uncharacterized protein with PIN domain